MSDDHEALLASWKRTADHLNAAQAQLPNLSNVELSPTREYLAHNELGLAFDCLVDLGHSLELPLAYWQHLDRAACEMQLYSAGADTHHKASAETCRLHLEAESGTK
ncbi:MafI family immunity protein [Nocardia colli]|uniref:MafI family immunity protein n=1 Tax=Nocardia colli TaxID=2545717 RepID=UPI0035DD859B